jgi:hypothetical protein
MYMKVSRGWCEVAQTKVSSIPQSIVGFAAIQSYALQMPSRLPDGATVDGQCSGNDSRSLGE